MHPGGTCLDPFFHGYVQRGEPLALATVVRTIGSTYRKPGAQMLIGSDGRSAGLLSGGCLESDLAERARSVIQSGKALLIDYDSRISEDLLWGLGLGCEGAMRILLTRLEAASGYEPYAFLSRCRAEDRAGRIASVVESATPALPLGTTFCSDAVDSAPAAVRAELTRQGDSVSTLEMEGAKFLISTVPLRIRLLVLGAGPDAMPLVEFAGLLDWHVTILDHRSAYAVAERFPRAQRVTSKPAASLSEELVIARYDAAVVMSHHLPSDELYLAALSLSDVPYVGLLGPAPRRARLMQQLGARADALRGRLYGPVGLDIGASTPETIALAIVAEILAVRSHRRGGSFSTTCD
jgi:xanthine dehydrogenase accessory factor